MQDRIISKDGRVCLSSEDFKLLGIAYREERTARKALEASVDWASTKD